MTYERDPATAVGVRRFTWPYVPPDVRNLVCLPYAGATSTVFKPLAHALGPMWQVIGIDPPGHGLGVPEMPLTSVPALCDVLATPIADALGSHGYLLGYSVGGYVAHALAAEVEGRAAVTPRALILCAVNPHAFRHLHPVYSALDDDALLEALDRLGGVPEALRGERSIFDMFKHVLRAGFEAYETAPPPAGVVTVPVLAVAGRQDALAQPGNIEGWRAYCRRFHIEQVDGSHVFLPDQKDEVARLLTGFANSLEDGDP